MVTAKVHKITRRHHEEVLLTAYARRLDKIYAEIGKSPMLPKVVKKMRDDYVDKPHELYLLVCKKYGITPEEEYDAYALVYGKTKFGKHKYKNDVNSRESEKTETKEQVVEVKKDATPDEVEEEYVRTKDDKYKFEMPTRRKFSWEKRSPKSEHTEKYKRTPKSEDSYRSERSPRDRGYESRMLDSPRVGSPRMHYRFNRKPVERLDYVNVSVGDVVETMVLTGSKTSQETGFWILARILKISEKENTMDLQVLEPKKYGLAAQAMNVPNRYVRSPANIVWKR